MMSLTKRFVSLLLVLVMALSMLPASAFAEESMPADLVEITVDAQTIPAEEPAAEEAPIEGEGEIPVIMEPVDAEATEPEEEEAPVEELPAEMTELEIMPEIEEAEVEIEAEPETESESETDLASIPMLLASDKYFELLDKQVSVHETAGVGTGPVDGKLTFTVGGNAYGSSAQEDTIEIRNETDKKSAVSFSYQVTGASPTKFTIDAASRGMTGSHSVILKPNEYVTIEFDSPLKGNTATLYLSDFAIRALPDQTEVAFAYNADLGSVSYNVIKDSVVQESGDLANGAKKNVSTDYGISLTAAPKAGARFLGWIHESDNALLSEELTYNYIPSENTTVKAVFITEDDTNPWFLVGTTNSKPIDVMGVADELIYNVIGTHLIAGFDAAASYSAESNSKAMVLLNDAILSGSHTLPAGVSLLVPFDAENTMYKTVAWAIEESHTTPTAYRTLTLAAGAKLVVNGHLSVSGQHRVTQGSRDDGCAPTGNVGFVTLQENSQIVINDGGALYAYGFVTGPGEVIAKSGAEVYELFQIADFRGGTQTTNMYSAPERVFMLSQYYVQNIESKLTLYAGAEEHSYATMFMQSMREASSIGFIGSGKAMFNLKSGYVTKRYDGATDRLIVEGYGDLSVTPVSLTVGPTTLSSADYVLPINGNITVSIRDGATITLAQDIALLPGAKIEIDEGAVCRLEEGRNVYVYDADDWGGYCSPNNVEMVPVKYAPGKKFNRSMNEDATILVNGEMDASGGYLYTTAGKANIYSTSTSGKATAKIQSGIEAVTYQVHQMPVQADSYYIKIPMTSAQLKNADGSYTGTDGIQRDYLAYVYKDGVWECDHQYPTEPTDSKAPTCYATGYEKYQCALCGGWKTNTLDKVPHDKNNYVNVNGKDPTCTETGLTAGVKCGVAECGAWITERTVIPANGHTEIITIAAVEPTCTAAGKTAEISCKVCGVKVQESEAIKEKGHTAETVPGQEATCTATGLTAGSKCSVCDTVLTEQTVIPAKGHTEVTDAAVDATCTATGLTEGEHCSVCNVVLVKQNVVPVLGHVMTITPAVPATCTAPGYEQGLSCSRCGEDLVPRVEKPALGHTEVEDAGYDATCTADGLSAGKHCDVCGEVTVKQVVIPSQGHDWGEGVVNPAPTCTEDGVRTFTCANCSETKTAVESALGHDMKYTDEVPATCTQPGSASSGYCTRCEHTEEAGEIAPLGHDWDDGVFRVEPTCTTAGEKLFTCKRCSENKTEEVAALGHTEVTDLAVESTCAKNGLTEGKHCSVCDAVIVAQTATEKKPHTEKIVEGVEPDCTNGGLTDGKECSVCHEVIVAQTAIAANGHTEVVDAAVAADCTTEGKTAGSHCSVCDAVIKPQATVAALGHKEEIDVAVAATCTTEGKTEGKHCSVCDAVIKAQETVPAKGHTEVTDAAVAATCLLPGKTEGKHCSVCNTVIKAQETIPAKGHTNVTVPAVAPTCTATGLTEGTKCADCGTVAKAQEIVDALGHDMVDGAVVTPATCLEAGVKNVSCKREGCGAKETAPIAALGHAWADAGIKTEPSCTLAGLKNIECIREGCTAVGFAEIPAKGHTEAEDKAVAPTCTKTGLTAGTHCSVCNEVIKAQETVPAAGHKEVVDPAVDGNCTDKTGLTEGKHCSVCSEVLVPQKEVPAGHKFDEAPCQTAPATCQRCGHVEQKQLDHKLSAASCTEPASCLYGCGYTTDKALGHTEVIDHNFPAMCEDPGLTQGSHCSVCGIVLKAQEEIPPIGHSIKKYEAKKPTFTSVGWEAYEECLRCAYTTYVEIPMLTGAEINDYETFMNYLPMLEALADEYCKSNPGKDPLALVIKYIRTGVDRYNSGSWGIMAGYEEAGFAQFVADYEDELNATAADPEQMVIISGLKNINEFKLPNGNRVDFGHMFGTMDITYHNYGSQNHADVGGWAGDLVDLLSTADRHNVTGSLEEMVETITKEYLGVALNESDTCSTTDIYGDLDAYYIMQNIDAKNYKAGDLTNLMRSYFVKTLTDYDRAEYLMNNRLGGASVRNELRRVVYNEYTSNKMVATLEGTRDFIHSDLSEMRKACCYAFADYICYLAGDYVKVTTNPYYTVFATESTTLAPGITQQINHATSADGKQMVYYLATGDLTRSDVHVYANYKDNDPTKGWGMQRVMDQANAAQERHSHIENYNVIAAINGSGYDMATGEPSGLLVMEGVEHHPINASGFFAIMKDGTPKIGTMEEYYECKDQIQEAIAGFGTTLVRDGELNITATSNYYSDRASRTAIGITKTGKIVFMVLDGRQEPVSCGGSMIEIAQIMQEAGCIEAINLDGGGSTTYVARQPGDDELSVVSKPSDGVARSVSTSMIMVSTAPSSTAFDHAVLTAEADYMTVGSSVQLTASGVSATGNAVELPEGTTWSVSDARWATITDDGVLTAQRNGSVEAYLKLGEEIVGRLTLNIVTPQQVYFTKTSVDVVYGASVELPVKALYENKPVAINPNDLVFTLSNAAGGTIEGFSFYAKEGTGLKNLKVTAALVSDPNATATISVALYNQGEASFDFDRATGGSRILAWDRKVSNSVTDDNNTYTVVDMSKDMVTSYIIALDMAQIPMPEELEDLTYMLPGADMEDACAWKFLLQLAERISVLSEVKAEMTIDKNFDVDISGLTVVNEYFQLNKTEFDPETNTVTLSLSWIDQTQPINEDEAKPLCIVSGIKLTPKKDAAWDAKDRLTVTNSGEISYKIYMRANGLYSFCLKPENQAIYGLQPFVNPNLESEKGGWFADTYTTFSDTYNLVNVSLNGWMVEEGGYAYYVNGERYFGIKEIDGLYYDFGKNGINVGKTTYTGLFYDETAKAYRYSNLGELQTGWAQIEGEWYYFLANATAASGRLKVNGLYFDFEENGKLVAGVWVNLLGGLRYYFGPDYYWRHWQQIDGDWYYFWDGYCYTGIKYIRTIEDNTKNLWYDLGDDGRMRGVVADGLHEFDGKLYLTKDGVQQEGLHKVGDDYYFFAYSGDVKRDMDYYAYVTHCDLPCGNYYFAPDGKLGNGVVEKSDGLYYYEKGKAGKAGLTKWNGEYYFVGSGGKLAIGEKYAYATNCDLGEGTYIFGSDGKMLRGVVTTAEGMFYYKNGKLVTGKAGITKIDGSYYYVDKNGKILTGTIDCTATNCDLPKGTYVFGADGKMLNGIVATDKGNVYYENGVAGGTKEGLNKIGDDYYFIGMDGQFATGEYYVSDTDCDLPRGNYEFGSDGKLLNGIVKMNDGVYYYEKGVAAGNNAGLTKVGNDYYLVDYTGKCETGKCYAWKTNCDLPRGYYEFGSDGKMLQGIVVSSNGVFYYENGNPSGSKVGLNKFGDAYYFVSYTGECETGSYYAWKTNCDLPRGSYEFGSDGKMLDGFVKKADGIYYYVQGKAASAGVYKVDGYFYCVQNNSGKLVVSQQYKVSDPNNVLIEGTYTFNALGQITG